MKKKLTKKHIASVLRSLDPTKIFQLVHQSTGAKVTRSEVFDYIQEHAPSQKVYDSAFKIAYNARNDWKRVFPIGCDKSRAITLTKLFILQPTNPYMKRPILGNRHLWFCSRYYGHSDYNKIRSIEIEGNEEFCNKLIAIADKY